MNMVLSAIFDSFCKQSYKDASISEFRSDHHILSKLFKWKSLKSYEYLYIIFFDVHENFSELVPIASNSGGHINIDMKNIAYILLNSKWPKFIVTHNHPGGTLSPSLHDIDFTIELSKMAKKSDKQFIDHVIWTQKGIFSFSKHNIVISTSLN